MKKINYILLFLITFFVLEGEVLPDEPLQNKYPFKSAVIHYEIKGQTQNGTEDLYIQGIKTRREKHIIVNALNRTEKQDLLVIDDGINVYYIDLNKKTGTKMLSPRKMLEDLTPGERKKMEETGKVLIKGITGKTDNIPIGTEEILGKPCEIYEIFGVKSWQWEGIPLKTEMEMVGKNAQVATSIETDVTIPASRFRVPSGIKIKDITGEQKDLLKKNILQNLPVEEENPN